MASVSQADFAAIDSLITMVDTIGLTVFRGDDGQSTAKKAARLIGRAVARATKGSVEFTSGKSEYRDEAIFHAVVKIKLGRKARYIDLTGLMTPIDYIDPKKGKPRMGYLVREITVSYVWPAGKVTRFFDVMLPYINRKVPSFSISVTATYKPDITQSRLSPPTLKGADARFPGSRAALICSASVGLFLNRKKVVIVPLLIWVYYIYTRLLAYVATRELKTSPIPMPSRCRMEVTGGG